MEVGSVRVTVSLLAPRIRVGRRAFYIGILSRQAYRSDRRRAWGPIGGAATAAASPTFGRLVRECDITFWDETSTDLRLRVPAIHLSRVLDELERQIPVWGEGDLRRELLEELAGRELRAIAPDPVLSAKRVGRIGVRFLRCVRQPRNGGFVPSQRVGGNVPTKRLLFFYELVVSRRTFRIMRGSPLIRSFSPADLPGADDPPAATILLGDGTERRGHLLRV